MRRSSGDGKMQATAEAKSLLLQIVGPVLSKKEAATIAARRLGWSLNRCKDIIKLEPRIRISAEEIEALRAKAEAKKRGGNDEILARIERLETILFAKDEAFYRPQIDALRAAAGRMGGED